MATAGKTGQVWVEGSGGDAAVGDAVAKVTSWEVDVACDTVDITGMSDAGLRRFLAGLTAATGRCSLVADTDNDILDIGTTCTVAFLYESGAASYWLGDAIITDVKPTVSVDGAVLFDCELQFDGGATYSSY